MMLLNCASYTHNGWRSHAIFAAIGVMAILTVAAVRADALGEVDLRRPVTVTLDEPSRQLLIPLEGLTPEARAAIKSASVDTDQVTLSAGLLHDILIAIMGHRADFRINHPDGKDHEAVMLHLGIMRVRRHLDLQATDMNLSLEHSPRMHDIRQAVAAEIAKANENVGKIFVQVTDMCGKPLDDVLLEISYSQPGASIHNDASRGLHTLRVSGEHVVESNIAWSATVVAFKEGYYHARGGAPFRKQLHDEAFEHRVWADALNGREHFAYPLRQTLTLRMRQHGNPIALQRYDGMVAFNINGKSTVTSLGLVQDKARRHVNLEDCTFEVVVDSEAELLALGTNVVSIQAPLNAEGKLADLVVFGEGDDAKVFPQLVTLKMHDPEGGFILHDLNKHRRGPWSREFFAEAPAEGYTPELRLSAEQLRDGIEFFLLNNGHYGRGTMWQMRTSDDRSAIMSNQFTIRLNPTPGDRNLEDSWYAHDQLNQFID